MQHMLDHIERRTLARRAAINSGIRAIHERRTRDRRGDNSRIADWLARFDELRERI